MAACRATDTQQKHQHFSCSSAGELQIKSPTLRFPSSCSTFLSTQLPPLTIYFPQQPPETLCRSSVQIPTLNQEQPFITSVMPSPPWCLDSSLKLPPDFHPGQPVEESSFKDLAILSSAGRSKDQRFACSRQVSGNRVVWMSEAGADGELVDISSVPSTEISNANALSASKSHSEAEKRRRERINKHLATLRDLLPNSTKTDKASLLAEVIEYIKELKSQAADSLEEGFLPSDTDQQSVAVDLSRQGKGSVIRVSISCNDRPDLLSEFTQTLRTLGLKPVRAEFVTLAGRMKNVFIMTCEEDYKETNEDSPSESRVQEALKAVLEKSTSTSFRSRKLNKQ